ncbi:MAG: hypothetical protein ACX939_14130, partial [Hyphococcus sp.]
RAPSAPFMVFHDAPTKRADLDIEVCIPLSDPSAANATLIEGSALACAVIYQGGYYKTDALHADMTAWIESAGLEPAGPMREIYHRFGADQEDYRLPPKMLAKSSAEYLTELLIPVSL